MEADERARDEELERMVERQACAEADRDDAAPERPVAPEAELETRRSKGKRFR